MTSTPKVPGLADEWAEHQLALALNEYGAVDGDLEPLAPICGSCTKVPGQPGAWDCDPDRPGCPLHRTPEQTRDRGTCYAEPRNWCRYNVNCRSCLGVDR